MLCLVFGLACLWQFVSAFRTRRGCRRRQLIVCGTLGAMAAWLLLVVESKTSLACFLLAGGFMVLISISKTMRRPMMLSFASLAIVGGAFAVLFLGLGGGALEAMGRNSSLTGRTDVWRAVLKYAENPIIGSG